MRVSVTDQLELFGPTTEAALYHNAGSYGFFSLNTRRRGEDMRQRSYLLRDMPQVLGHLDPAIDTWLSQAEFRKPNRRVVNLLRVGLLFVDLDYYRIPVFARETPDAMLFRVWCYLEEAGLPLPSLAISSGKGLQLKWLLDQPLPRAALPRWNQCQRELVRWLDRFGADPAAKDASRILRVVQTVNSKSNEVTRVIHAPQHRHNFDRIADLILPRTRFEIEEQREQRRLQPVKSGSKKRRRGNTPKGFSGRQLAWHRLEDLRLLSELRGGVAEGERMQHLFWRLNFLLLSGATNSVQMWHEATALAHELDPSWGYGSSELSTLYRKAKAAEAGDTVDLGGRKWTPLYTPRNQTLIDLFGIKPHEESQLRTIISKSEAAQRDRRRHRKYMTRAEYEGQSISRQKPWEALGISRASWYRKGKPKPHDDGL